jgi:hypothetical protein
MQNALRPYATAGIALVGASIIAVTPMVAQSPSVQMRPVKLVDAWSTLLSDTTMNLDAIVGNANTADITQVFSALLTNPLGVIGALTNLDPTVSTDASGLPITVGVQLTPALEMGLAQLGAEGATLEAVNGVLAQLAADPSNALSILYEGTATVLNAGLNGATDVSLLGGIIDIPIFNGLLAPETSMTVDLNLTDLVNALGLGSLNLSNLDLSGLLGQLGLGDVSLDSLLTDLGISGDKLGDLLANLSSPITSLGGLLNLLGLNDLGLNQGITLGLTDILKGLGLDTGVNLNSLTLSDVLGDFGINTSLGDLSNLSLSSILSSFGVDLPSGATLASTTLTGLLTDLHLNSLGLGDLLQNAVTSGVLGNTVGPLITALLATSKSLLNEVNLGQLLSGVSLGQGVGGSLSLDTLLGDLGIHLPGSTDLSNIDIADVLTSLGVKLPGDLSIGTLLGELGFSSTTGDLTLGTLLSDLGDPFGNLSITGLLDNITLGGLVDDLGLGKLDLDLTTLVGDLSNLNLGDLLGDLGLGDLATVTIDPFGGLITELVDTVPGQILAAL